MLGVMFDVTRPILVVSFCALVFPLAACSGKQTTVLAPTSISPASQGEVTTRRTDNANTEVDLQVRHMAPPEKVAPGATVYVVWAQPLSEDATPQNVGALVIGKNREASLRTLTPLKRFELSVTPEPAGSVTQPSNEPVMKAKVAR